MVHLLEESMLFFPVKYWFLPSKHAIILNYIYIYEFEMFGFPTIFRIWVENVGNENLNEQYHDQGVRAATFL